MVGVDDEFLGGVAKVGAAVADYSIGAESELEGSDVSDDAEAGESSSHGHVVECCDGGVVWAQLVDSILPVAE